MKKETEKIQLLMSKYGFNEVTAVAYVNSNGKCAYCGVDIFNNRLGYESSEVDHILPKSIFPELEWDINNVALSCKVCNSLKSNLNVLFENEDPVNMLKDHKDIILKRINSNLESKRIELEKNWKDIISLISN